MTDHEEDVAVVQVGRLRVPGWVMGVVAWCAGTGAVVAGTVMSQPGATDRAADGVAFLLVGVASVALLGAFRWPVVVAGVVTAALLGYIGASYPGGPVLATGLAEDGARQADAPDPVTVPIAYAVGSNDTIACPTRDCTTDPAAGAADHITPRSGHSINTSLGAPLFYRWTFDWLARNGIRPAR